ncbi:hypothetical protein K474DRAFT_883010 [Panus rudis PR-1116 ss-1]|nr:hypothetical protein K474DRAFT_883010 [Panus rudis PR-1116 ss-1]
MAYISPFAKEGRTQLVILGVLVALSLYLDIVLVGMGRTIKAQTRERVYKPPKPIDSYSLVGTDFPKRIPVELGAIKVPIEESVHYGLYEPEAPNEWLWNAPYGDSHIRLGDDTMRAFAVPIFHQLHCFRGLRTGLEVGWANIPKGHQGHNQHCFNYLRQWTLCSADTTLEPGDFTKRNFTVERVGATHTCKNWDPLYEVVNERWAKWEAWRKERGVPDQTEL